VLVVDDVEAIRMLAADALAALGYEVIETDAAASALALIRGGSFDAIILDLGLPGVSGFDLLADIRQFSDVPVLILSGRGDEDDRIHGLRLGADDYMVKPFPPRELAERVHAVLRRATRGGATLDLSDVRIDFSAHEVTIDGGVIELTPREFDLLAYLARSPRVAFSREHLLKSVWDSETEWQTTATVTEHVRRVRTKIETDPEHPRRIVTVRGVGYRFEPRG
jgi:DNA-binding response OmpR family regulator